ncbi:MAG: YceH family protein [Verrucomicrobiales bacterium]
MDPLLTFAEARVLGCLLEKEATTPDNYPLSLAAVIAACNQTTNRDPVSALTESEVDESLAGLRRKKLAAMLHLAGSRVPKFKHLATDFFPGLQGPEFALLTVLLLRGAQTVAELRARTERLHAFPDAEAVEAPLRRLLDWQDGPLVAFQPPGGGRRAATYLPLLFSEPAVAVASPEIPSPPSAASTPVADWRSSMEQEIDRLRSRLDALEDALGITPHEGGER